MNIKILGKYIICEEIPPEVKSSLIITTNQANQSILRAVATSNDIDIAVGDKVLLNTPWTQKMKHEDKEYSLVPFDSIVGVIS